MAAWPSEFPRGFDLANGLPRSRQVDHARVRAWRILGESAVGILGDYCPRTDSGRLQVD